MDIQLISFALALIVGILCFALVKHTADEFDRWYEDPDYRASWRVPATVISAMVVSVAALLLNFTR